MQSEGYVNMFEQIGQIQLQLQNITRYICKV